MRTIAFISGRSGVGTTFLVHHLAWMYHELGLRVLVVDLDPQSKLTSMFLALDRLEEMWLTPSRELTVFSPLARVMHGASEEPSPHIEVIDERLGVMAGDPELWTLEESLAAGRSLSPRGETDSLDRPSSVQRVVRAAAIGMEADIVLIDPGPHLGMLGRAVATVAEHIIVPLKPDIFSAEALRILGPALRRWRTEWTARHRDQFIAPSAALPAIEPAGYILSEPSFRPDQPTAWLARWFYRLPGIYRGSVLGLEGSVVSPEDDPHCLAVMKNFRGLTPLATEAGKTMFMLKPADGAIGAYAAAVQTARADFEGLARRIASRVGLLAPA